MKLIISSILDALKARLREREEAFHTVNDMAGCTEAGFWEEHDFDMDALLAEIDKFGADLLANRIEQ